jgi:FkbM family methyltransferase
MKFYSQYKQDEWLFNNFFSEKKNGVFLEIGADDGIDKSNTLFFEETLGWTGICVEPSYERFKLLEKNRKCICENIALSNKTGEATFLDIKGWGKGLSGIIEDYCDNHKNRIFFECQDENNKGKEIIKVKTDLLNNILLKHNLYEIDFCTIDTEGSEYSILENFNFDKFLIKIFVIENNYGNDNVKNLLVKNNYKFLTKLEIDDVYIKIQE